MNRANRDFDWSFSVLCATLRSGIVIFNAPFFEYHQVTRGLLPGITKGRARPMRWPLSGANPQLRKHDQRMMERKPKRKITPSKENKATVRIESGTQQGASTLERDQGKIIVERKRLPEDGGIFTSFRQTEIHASVRFGLASKWIPANLRVAYFTMYFPLPCICRTNRLPNRFPCGRLTTALSVTAIYNFKRRSELFHDDASVCAKLHFPLMPFYTYFPVNSVPETMAPNATAVCRNTKQCTPRPHTTHSTAWWLFWNYSF